VNDISGSAGPDFSIVVPTYGCAATVTPLSHAIMREMSVISGNYEILFVDDHSPDQVWTTLQSLAAEDQRIKALRLAYNVGQPRAIAAGVTYATGRAVIVMDCDLQDPPSHLPALITAEREGNDLVLSPLQTRGQSGWRITASGIYYVFLRLVSGSPYPGRCSNYCLATRDVVRQFLASPYAGSVYMTALARYAHRIGTVPYHKGGRDEGRSAYSFRGLVHLAAVNFSGFVSEFISRIVAPVACAAVAVTLAAWWMHDGSWSALTAGFAIAITTVLTALILVTTRLRRLRDEIASELYRVADTINIDRVGAAA